MKSKIRIKCDKCGKIFHIGTRPDGLPNGIGMQMEDGSIYNMCADCLIQKGKEIKKRGRR